MEALNARRKWWRVGPCKGFAQHRQEAHHGMLIVRLRQPNEAKIHERVMRAVRQFPQQIADDAIFFTGLTPYKCSVTLTPCLSN